MEKVKRIAFILPNLLGEFSYSLWKTAKESIRKKGGIPITITPLMRYSDIDSSSKYTPLFSLISQESIDGILFLETTFQTFFPKRLIQSFKEQWTGIPLVSLSKESLKTSHVSIENRNGMKQLLDHLIDDHGYSQFSFIRGPQQNPEAETRFSVFLEVMEQRGLKVKEQWIKQGNFTPESVKNPVKEILEGKHLPEAIVCANDPMAMGVIDFMDEAGLIPGVDIAVTGFDNMKMAIQSRLTTVNQPLREQIDTALDHLYELMEDRKKIFSTIIESRPVIRATCGCIPLDMAHPQHQDFSFMFQLSSGYNFGYLHDFSQSLSQAEMLADLKRPLRELLNILQINDFILILFNDGEPLINNYTIETPGEIFFNLHSPEKEGNYISIKKILSYIPIKKTTENHMIAPLVFQGEIFGLFKLSSTVNDNILLNILKGKLEKTFHNFYIRQKRAHSAELSSRILKENQEILKILTRNLKTPLEGILSSFEHFETAGNIPSPEQSRKIGRYITQSGELISQVLVLRKVQEKNLRKENIPWGTFYSETLMPLSREHQGLQIQGKDMKKRTPLNIDSEMTEILLHQLIQYLYPLKTHIHNVSCIISRKENQLFIEFHGLESNLQELFIQRSLYPEDSPNLQLTIIHRLFDKMQVYLKFDREVKSSQALKLSIPC